jgi:3-isopropylmalate dehydrogenase
MSIVMKKIAVLDGDGIGPEVTEQAIKALNAIAKVYGHTFDYRYALVGAIAIDKTGNPLPDETLAICNDSDAILFGAIGDPKYDNDPNAKVRPEQGLLKLRKTMGLYANIRPVKAYDTLLDISPLKSENIKGIDFVVYRELTGGIYFGEKTRSADGKSASDLCSYHVDEIERIAHQAFKAALLRRKKVTLVDKANVLETSRLWRDTVQKMTTQYPEVTLEYLFVDNAAMQMIQNPRQFDVILTENMFGDIISDEASVITGSLGLLPSASVGDKTAMFEPIHGSYPQAAGLDIANPIAAILSAAMLLDYLALHAEAEDVRRAVDVLLLHNIVTKDLNPTKFYSTSVIGDLIAEAILKKNEPDFHPQNVLLGSSTII